MVTKKAYMFLALLLLFPVTLSFNAFPKENRGFQTVEVAEESESPWGNYHALIIGINKYQEWPRLKTAVRDAEGLKDVLVRRYRFPEDQVIIKVDKEATRKAIIRDLRDLASNLTKKDNLLIYFAGHGQLDDLTGDGFWVPVEGKPKAPDTWISHSNIKNILSSEKVIAKNIVVVADSCYSGTLLRGGPSLLSVEDKGYRLKLKKMASHRSRQVITSGGLEPVADGGRNGHSLFAYYLLRGLEENMKDVVDLENLFHTYVWKPVTEIGGQRPNVGRLKTPMDEDGQFVLQLNIEIVVPLSKREKKGLSEDQARLERERKELERLQIKVDRKKLEAEIKRLEAEKLRIAVDTKTPKTIINSIGMKFVLIPAGNFMMGSAMSASETAKEYGRHERNEKHYKNEHPQHQVSITKPFYLQNTEVTQGQWKRVMGNNPSFFKDCGENCPVEEVSWNDVQEFIKKLNSLEEHNKYRLPTEAEWEYACRADSTSRFYFGDVKWKEFGNYLWYFDNSYYARKTMSTQTVGEKKPNAWGLYDMYGNVWEFCQDWYGPYDAQPAIDPKGPSSGKSRVVRGSSWFSDYADLGSPYRRSIKPDSHDKYQGFRVARDL
jgi:formylglycine-generating enzyme required for sulfatase activity